MATFAVIETGGKQYKVGPGEKVKVEKIAGEAGDKVVFDKVLLTADGDSAKIGEPYLDGGTVEGKVIRQARTRKVTIFKYHSKTRHRRRKGHRQQFTEVEITKI